SQPVEYDARRFQLLVGPPGQVSNFLFLGNAYEEYCNVPKANRPVILQRYFAQRLPGPPSKDVALRNLLPRVRDRAYYTLLNLRLQAQVGPQPAEMHPVVIPHRPLAHHFAVSLIFDLPTSVMDLAEERFTEWGLGFDEAYATALDNLKELSVQPFDQPRPGVHVSPFRDNHDPARLLLVDKILRLPVKGHPVAVIPNRDTLIITGSDDPAGLEEMADLAKVALLEPRASNPLALQLTPSGEWVPYLPAGRLPIDERYRLMAVQSLLRDYGEQKELLAASHEREGRDVFVATFSGVQDKQSGKVSSYCTWTEDVVTLLPRALSIAFIRLSKNPDGEPEVMRVPWELALPVVGHRMKL
ncbi:MAG: DUF1444 domain-containing protein, partial [Myxococcaceae bacterium]